jgi:hypothetical protein
MLCYKDERLRIVNRYDMFFWFLIAVCTTVIALSYPMMKLKYDIWDHVDIIRNMVLDSSAPSPAKRYWYASWAFVFRLFNITDLFTIAIVIHRVQFIANCMIIYTSAKQIFEPLLSLSRFDKYQNQWLSGLALSSTLIWLTTIGTFSFIQQAWIMWYSVNYQITLSFLLLSISLCVNVLTINQSKYIVIFKIISIISLLIMVLTFHAGELAYFIFYLPIIIVCFTRKINIKIKDLVAYCIAFFLVLYFGIKFYVGRVPLLITLFKDGELTKIATVINDKGVWNVVEGGNRYAGNWNEMYTLNVVILLLIGLLVVLNKISVHKRVLAFLVFSLVFCFAPSYVFSSGFLSIVSYEEIVNRYYFASFLFLALPLCIYLIICKFKYFNHVIYLTSITTILIAIIYFHSKFYNNQGVFYHNVKSITTSMKAKKLDIEVSQSEIADVEKQIQIAEATFKTNDFIYCGSYKKIHIVTYLFNRKNVHFDRVKIIGLSECEKNAKDSNKRVVYIQ